MGRDTSSLDVPIADEVHDALARETRAGARLRYGP